MKRLLFVLLAVTSITVHAQTTEAMQRCEISYSAMIEQSATILPTKKVVEVLKAAAIDATIHHKMTHEYQGFMGITYGGFYDTFNGLTLVEAQQCAQNAERDYKEGN
jgi:hypothetical protein